MSTHEFLHGSTTGDRSMKQKMLLIGFSAFAVTAGLAHAQDWLAVSPQGKTLKLENAHVRVVEISMAPGQKEPIHTHPANFAHVLSPAKLKVTYIGGPSEVFEPKAGDVLWSDPEGPHTVENVDTKPFKALLVEMKDLPYVEKKK
jgi:quercetin dioxygenase-like cupin family protein